MLISKAHCCNFLANFEMTLKIIEEDDLDGNTLQFIVTYFAPQRQHTVEVLTQNWLYCTFRRSPAISICSSAEKDFVTKYDIQICSSAEKDFVTKYDIQICWSAEQDFVTKYDRFRFVDPPKKISSNIAFRFVDPVKKILCPNMTDSDLCVVTLERSNNAGLVFKENLIWAAIFQMAKRSRYVHICLQIWYQIIFFHPKRLFNYIFLDLSQKEGWGWGEG